MIKLVGLLSLAALTSWGLKFGTEDTIPESAGDAKAVLKISVMVLEVVLLQFLVVHRKAREKLVSNIGRFAGDGNLGENSLAMVEEVVCQIVAHVTEDTAAVYLHSREPVVEEDSMGQLPKWSCKEDKQCGWHDQSVLVHWKVVVDTMEQEVEGQTNAVVRKPARISSQ